MPVRDRLVLLQTCLNLGGGECGGRVWSTFVVLCIYGVQCVVVGVTCGARSHIALRLWCTYIWREAHIYREWCAIAHGSQYNVNERSESI